MFLKHQLVIRARAQLLMQCLVLLDNLDFKLAVVVADGAVQTAVKSTKLEKTGKLLAVVDSDNSHSQCSDSFVI
jgi:hypothetical protein